MTLRNWITIALLFCAGLGASGQFAKFAVPFEATMAAWPNAGVWLGLMISVVSFLGLFFGLVAGQLVSRLGASRLIIFALALGAAMSFIQAFLPPIWAMMGTRLLEGLSHLLITVAAPTLMATLASDRWRNLVMTIWSTFFALSFAVVAWAGLPMVEANGLGWLINAHGIWMALICAALWLVLPRGLVQAQKSGNYLKEQLAVARSPHMAAPAWGWLFYTLTYVSMLTVLPPLLAPEIRGGVSSLMPLMGLVVSLTLGVFLLRFISPVQLVMLGFGVALIFVLGLAALPHNAAIILLMMAVLGLVQSGSFAAVPALNRNPADQALANGFMAQMGNLGNLLGTPILLFVLAKGPASWLYLVVGLFYALGLGVHFYLLRARQGRA